MQKFNATMMPGVIAWLVLQCVLVAGAPVTFKAGGGDSRPFVVGIHLAPKHLADQAT